MSPKENGVVSQAAKPQEKSKQSKKAGSTELPTPPDGGWGWMVVFGSFMIHVVADGVAYSFGVFLPTFLVYFDSPRSETAWLGSLMIGVTWGSGKSNVYNEIHLICPSVYHSTRNLFLTEAKWFFTCNTDDFLLNCEFVLNCMFTCAPKWLCIYSIWNIAFL